MTIEAAAKFRKKPVAIEAVQWDGQNDAPIKAFCDNFAGPFEDTLRSGRAKPYLYLRIATAEGAMRADPGDWIIKGIKGEFYPCKPDIFEATYEPVEELRSHFSAGEVMVKGRQSVIGKEPDRIDDYSDMPSRGWYITFDGGYQDELQRHWHLNIAGEWQDYPGHDCFWPTREAAAQFLASLAQPAEQRLAKCGHPAYRNHDNLCIQEGCPHAAYVTLNGPEFLDDVSQPAESATHAGVERPHKDDPLGGKTPWEFACAWYTPGQIAYSIARSKAGFGSFAIASPSGDSTKIPPDIYSAEFAEWLTNQYRLAMKKGIEIGRAVPADGERQEIEGLKSENKSEREAAVYWWRQFCRQTGREMEPTLDANKEFVARLRELESAEAKVAELEAQLKGAKA